MTHAEEIIRGVASIIKKGDTRFHMADIRDELGLSADEWQSGYNAIFQDMRTYPPGSAHRVPPKFEGVFKRVSHGVYTLTEYGEKLIKMYNRHRKP